MQREVRTLPLELAELRVERRAEEPATISGFAAVFNQLSEDLGGFREQIAPGAFDKTLGRGDEVVALFNHDPNFPLGRRSAENLKLRREDRGLRMTIRPPDTQRARDLIADIDAGNICGSSFAFSFDDFEKGQKWETDENGENIRTLLEVRLWDVSPVTFPAYPQTSVAVRSLADMTGIDSDRLSRVCVRASNSLPLIAGDIDILRETIRALESLLREPDEKDIHIDLARMHRQLRVRPVEV